MCKYQAAVPLACSPGDCRHCINSEMLLKAHTCATHHHKTRVCTNTCTHTHKVGNIVPARPPLSTVLQIAALQPYDCASAWVTILSPKHEAFTDWWYENKNTLIVFSSWLLVFFSVRGSAAIIPTGSSMKRRPSGREETFSASSCRPLYLFQPKHTHRLLHGHLHKYTHVTDGGTNNAFNNNTQ